MPATKPPATTSATSQSADMPAGKLAYSYLRVSSAQQAGDSRSGLDRQSDAFLPFCERHGLIPSLDPLVDAGISAFRGSNRRRGALAAWLAAARAGDVAPGSTLVVEDLDRFSREAPADTLRTLLNEVFGLGLALGVTRFDTVLTEEEFNHNAGAALQLQIGVSMAHEYSSKLGKRVAAAYDRKRQRAKNGEIVLPNNRPHWLDWDQAAGVFRPNHHAATYQRIVELGIAGYGQVRAARVLNEEGFRNAQGNPWSPSAVSKVWRDRRLIGERHFNLPNGADPLLLAGHFPSVIGADDFDRCQKQVDHRRGNVGRSGRGDKRRNILQGVLHCTCGQQVGFMKIKGADGRHREYLFCKGRYHWKGIGERCPVTLIRYDELWILRAFMGQRWAQYFNRPADNKIRRQLEHKVREAETLLAQQRQHQQQAEHNLAQLLLAGTLDADTAALLGKAAKQASHQADETANSLKGLQDQLQQASLRPDGAAMQQQIRERVQAFLTAGVDDPAERVRLNSWIATLGVRVTITRDDLGLQLSIDKVQPVSRDDAGNVTVAGAEIYVKLPPELHAQLSARTSASS